MQIDMKKQPDYKFHYNGTFWHLCEGSNVIAAFKSKEHANMFIALLKAEKEIFERIMKELTKEVPK